MKLRKYETLILFNPDMSNSERQEVLEDLTNVVEQEYKGKLLITDDWGIKELAYPVNKHTRGHYVRIEYGVPGNAIQEVERKLRLNEDVFKFLTVKLEDKFEIEED
ncbi:30S ribosomal protein S6 [Desulfothermus okinawensis JCM 13304]